MLRWSTHSHTLRIIASQLLDAQIQAHTGHTRRRSRAHTNRPRTTRFFVNTVRCLGRTGIYYVPASNAVATNDVFCDIHAFWRRWLCICVRVCLSMCEILMTTTSRRSWVDQRRATTTSSTHARVQRKRARPWSGRVVYRIYRTYVCCQSIAERAEQHARSARTGAHTHNIATGVERWGTYFLLEVCC